MSRVWIISLLGAFVACSDEIRVETMRDGGSSGNAAAVAAGIAGGAAGETAAGQGGGPVDVPVNPELVCTGDLPVMKIHDTNTGASLDPDWSCYPSTSPSGNAPLPATGPTRTVAFRVRTTAPAPWLVAGVTVDFFLNSSTLGMPAVARVFDETSGLLMFDIPAGTATISARIHALMRDMPAFNVVELREYRLPVPTSNAPIEGEFLIRDMRALAVNLALGGGQEDATKALLLSNARDCSGRYVSGAQFELIDGETNLAVQGSTAPGGIRISYAQLALPSTTCTFTSADQAAWMMINAPVNVTGDVKTHSYRLRLKGRMRPTDVQPVLLGESEVELFSGGTSSVVLYRQTSA